VVFLAHIGSFVPADSAVVGLTDRFVFVLHVYMLLIKGIYVYYCSRTKAKGQYVYCSLNTVIVLIVYLHTDNFNNLL
jgi:hypothetical protein